MAEQTRSIPVKNIPRISAFGSYTTAQREAGEAVRNAVSTPMIPRPR